MQQPPHALPTSPPLALSPPVRPMAMTRRSMQPTCERSVLVAGTSKLKPHAASALGSSRSACASQPTAPGE
eukprot:scaffold85785_cov63-Phaeocystis_antarctica.AAC.1